MRMECVGLEPCMAYSLALTNCQSDLEEIGDNPSEIAALQIRFFKATQLLAEVRTAIFNHFPPNQSLDRIEIDFRGLIEKLDPFYGQCRSSDVSIVSKKCHDFFFYYLESLLLFLLLTEEIALGCNPDKILQTIDRLEQRFSSFGFTDLTIMLENMRQWVPTNESHALLTTYIPELPAIEDDPPELADKDIFESDAESSIYIDDTVFEF